MLSRNRFLTVLIAAGYLLAVSGSALFHDHSDGCGRVGDHLQPGLSLFNSTDTHDCSVCQFLAHKPVPVEEVTPIHSTALVQNVVAPSSFSITGEIFSAWQSRAPPACA